MLTGAQRGAPRRYEDSALCARTVLWNQLTRPTQRFITRSLEKVSRQTRRVKPRPTRRTSNASIEPCDFSTRLDSAPRAADSRRHRNTRRRRSTIRTNIQISLVKRDALALPTLRAVIRRTHRHYVFQLSRRALTHRHVRRNPTSMSFNQFLRLIAHAVHRQRHVSPRRNLQHQTHQLCLFRRRDGSIRNLRSLRRFPRRSAPRRVLPRPLKLQRLRLRREPRDDEYHITRSHQRRVPRPVGDDAVVLRQSSRWVIGKANVGSSFFQWVERHDEVTREKRTQRRRRTRVEMRTGRGSAATAASRRHRAAWCGVE